MKLKHWREHIIDGLTGASIAYAARCIEIRIESRNFHCDCCKSVFVENEKLDDASFHLIEFKRPCVSTYSICKIADRFISLHRPVHLNHIANSVNKRDFRVLYYMIFKEDTFLWAINPTNCSR